jgi:hypothetical protein
MGRLRRSASPTHSSRSPDRFETIEFPARDDFRLNFKRLQPESGLAGEPVLMVAGTGTRANLWNPPTDNLLKQLTNRGFDLWMLN